MSRATSGPIFPYVTVYCVPLRPLISTYYAAILFSEPTPTKPLSVTLNWEEVCINIVFNFRSPLKCWIMVKVPAEANDYFCCEPRCLAFPANCNHVEGFVRGNWSVSGEALSSSPVPSRQKGNPAVVEGVIRSRRLPAAFSIERRCEGGERERSELRWLLV